MFKTLLCKDLKLFFFLECSASGPTFHKLIWYFYITLEEHFILAEFN